MEEFEAETGAAVEGVNRIGVVNEEEGAEEGAERAVVCTVKEEG